MMLSLAAALAMLLARPTPAQELDPGPGGAPPDAAVEHRESGIQPWAAAAEWLVPLPEGSGLGVELKSIPFADLHRLTGSFRAEATAPYPAAGSTGRFVKLRIQGQAAYSLEAKTPDSLPVGAGRKLEALVEGKHVAGRQATYDLILPRNLYGRLPRPNPFEPETMPAESSFVMRSDEFELWSLGTGVRWLKAGGDVTSTHGQAFGGEKLPTSEGNKMRVFVGPAEAVKANVHLGAAFGPITVGFASSTRVGTYQLRTAVFDMASASGVTLYHRFLLTGRLDEGAAGLERVGTIKKVDLLEEDGVFLKLKDVPLGLPISLDFRHVLSWKEAETKLTRYDDGASEREETVTTGDRAVRIVTRHEAPAEWERGKRKGQARQTITVLLGDVERRRADEIDRSCRGATIRATSPRVDLQLSMTEAQAWELRENARALQRALKAKGRATPGLVLRLAAAQNPVQVGLAFAAEQSPFGVEIGLKALAEHMGGVPAELTLFERS